jgi:DNA-directed RNA polymerase subunit RPC12/RpoP
MDYTCGEKPGIGSYTCRDCGETVFLDNSGDALPPCPSCEGCRWRG